MRDAFGGIVNITFIVVFMVIVNGYLAFAANYNKAFRVKNKIISLIEQSEGWDSSNAELKIKIQTEMKQVGYATDLTLSDDSDYKYDCESKLGYCVGTPKKIENETGEIRKVTYKVVTAVNIDIPILRNFIPKLSAFQVSGTTKAITQH